MQFWYLPLMAILGIGGLCANASAQMPRVDFDSPMDQVVHIDMNHETEVAANCVASFGVSWPAAGCIASLLTVEEIDKCFKYGFGGRGCFGDNNTMVAIVRDNIVAAQRENGDVNVVIRAITGVSPGDIQRYGLAGGHGSEMNRECRRLPKWGFPCG